MTGFRKYWRSLHPFDRFMSKLVGGLATLTAILFVLFVASMQ